MVEDVVGPSRIVARFCGAAAALVATVAGLATGDYLASRGPCPPGSVSFLDFAPATLVALIVVAVSGLGTVAAAAPQKSHRPAASIGAALLVTAAVLAVIAVATITAGSNSRCYSF